MERNLASLYLLEEGSESLNVYLGLKSDVEEMQTAGIVQALYLCVCRSALCLSAALVHDRFLGICGDQHLARSPPSSLRILAHRPGAFLPNCACHWSRVCRSNHDDYRASLGDPHPRNDGLRVAKAFQLTGTQSGKTLLRGSEALRLEV